VEIHAIFEQAQQEFRLLESHWISLLSWLSTETGVAAEDLVKAWSADEYYKANTRLTADTKKVAGAKWTILDFIDFGSYVYLASRHSDKLAPLGTPAKDWVARINKQLSAEGLVGFRNHLQHANRFALLPKAEQERGITLLKAQGALLTKWWPDCPVSLKVPPVESPLRAALRALSADPDDALPIDRANRPEPDRERSKPHQEQRRADTTQQTARVRSRRALQSW
jgi:hypothetical protein